MENQKYTWRKAYTVVLAINALYIFLFYLFMKILS